MPPTAPPPVKTARRREIVQQLNDLARDIDTPNSTSMLLSEAALIIEGRGIPFDELGTLPTHHSTDPDTSRAFTLRASDRDAHFRLLAAFEFCALMGYAGYTPDQAAEHAKLRPGPGPRKRVSELKSAGLIEGTNLRRPSALGRSAEVLTITEFGRSEFKRVTS